MNVGLTDDTEYSNCGEIHSIYILNGYKGYGYGKKMIDVGIEELKTRKCDKMLIGCLVGNPSNDFYIHLGGKVVKQRFVEDFNYLKMYIILTKFKTPNLNMRCFYFYYYNQIIYNTYSFPSKLTIYYQN